MRVCVCVCVHVCVHVCVGERERERDRRGAHSKQEVLFVVYYHDSLGSIFPFIISISLLRGNTTTFRNVWKKKTTN